MKWSFRHYGKKDTIPVKHVRQIPRVKGVVGTLLGKIPGEVWEIEEIQNLKKNFNEEGLELYGIESVAVHDAIKAATNERDLYIDNYKQTLRNLAECGIHLVCYSFKPVFGWTKTDLNFKNDDGSHSLLYDDAVLQEMNPRDMYKLIKGQSKGFQLSGWEEERLQEIDKLMELYKDVTEEDLFNNLKYFLEQIIPVCEEVDVKLGIHPDDPPWENFGLPKITHNLNDVRRILKAVDSPYNGITLCTGAFGGDPNNDMVEFVHEIADRINFVHFRNVEYLAYRKFKEVAHYSQEGSLDMHAIMEALIEVGFDGIIRPDHGRMIWDEKAIPGYGLYDRALGITYMQGLHESITKIKARSRKAMKKANMNHPLYKKMGEVRLMPLYTVNDLDILPLAEDILVKNDVLMIEVAYRSKLATEAIRILAKSGKIVVGAGTVRTLKQAKEAVEAGAKFVVSPCIAPEVIEYCIEKDIPIFPGAVTPSEIQTLISNYGINIVKFFPADIYGGLKAMKALSGPLPDVKFLPTGGVNGENFTDYLKEKFIFGVGGSFVLTEEGIKKDGTGKWADENLATVVKKRNEQ